MCSEATREKLLTSFNKTEIKSGFVAIAQIIMNIYSGSYRPPRIYL